MTLVGCVMRWEKLLVEMAVSKSWDSEVSFIKSILKSPHMRIGFFSFLALSNSNSSFLMNRGVGELGDL